MWRVRGREASLSLALVVLVVAAHLDEQIEEGLFDNVVHVRVNVLGSVVRRLERYDTLAVVAQAAEFEREAIMRRAVFSYHSSLFKK